MTVNTMNRHDNSISPYFPIFSHLPVVPVGIGAFLGEACAWRLNLATCDPPALTESGSLALSPCAAAAYLLRETLSHG